MVRVLWLICHTHTHTHGRVENLPAAVSLKLLVEWYISVTVAKPKNKPTENRSSTLTERKVQIHLPRNKAERK